MQIPIEERGGCCYAQRLCRGICANGQCFDAKREQARKRALEVAAQLTGKTYDDDTFLIISSGRYEFKNKGIDLFIEALKRA